MKFTQNKLRLPDGYRLKVFHMHSASDPSASKREIIEGKILSHKRNKATPYVTVALLYDAEGGRVAEGLAICNPKDQPNRRRGWQIAVGRCIKTATIKGCI